MITIEIIIDKKLVFIILFYDCDEELIYHSLLLL
jgi:hypothetical protein